MEIIRIYGDKNFIRVREIIRKNLVNKDLYWEEDTNGIDYEIGIFFEGSYEDIDHIVYRDLVDTIENIIIDVYLEDTIIYRVGKIYSGENIEVTKELLDKIKGEIRVSYTYIEEKIEVRERLKDYLIENDYIDILGYMHFRLGDYLYILDTAIDNIVSKMKKDKNVEDFLNMIQYFVDVKEPKFDYLNVFLNKNNFFLKDVDNKEVGQDIIKKVRKEFENDIVSKSDLLISTLIIMSPKRVVVHSKNRDSSIVKAIEEIFRDRFVFCGGCNLCSEY